VYIIFKNIKVCQKGIYNPTFLDITQKIATEIIFDKDGEFVVELTWKFFIFET